MVSKRNPGRRGRGKKYFACHGMDVKVPLKRETPSVHGMLWLGVPMRVVCSETCKVSVILVYIII